MVKRRRRERREEEEEEKEGFRSRRNWKLLTKQGEEKIQKKKEKDYGDWTFN